MAQYFRDKSGQLHQFPDDATPEEMDAAVSGMEPEKTGTKEDFSKAMGLQRTPVDTLRDVAQGALTGLGKGGQTIASLLTGGYAPTVDMDKQFQSVGSPNQSIGGEVAKGVGQYLPYGAAGGASLLGQLGAGAAFGAATTEPGEQNAAGWLPSGKLGGAIESAVINAITHGVFKGLNALRPSNLFRGKLSPKELQHNLDVTQGTQTNLGDVVGSPFLKRQYENVLPQVPFSRAGETMANAGEQVTQKGEDLFHEIGIDKETHDQTAALKTALKDASKEARADKDKDYTTLNKMADDAKLKVGRDNFSGTAAKILDDIKQSPELAREFDPGFLSDLKSYAANNEGNNLKLSNIFKGKIGDKANDFYTTGKMHEYGIAKQLQDALQKDIDNSIESSGNDKIKEQYVKSQQNYATKYAPFEDPDVVKFTRQGGDSDLLLSHFLRTGPNDRATLLTKLIDKLPEAKTALPLQIYLSQALEGGKLNPLKFRALYNKLGENQKSVLIPDKIMRQKLENYSNLVGKNTEPLSIMANPKTGQRNMDAVKAMLMTSIGSGLGGGLGAVAGTALPIMTARMATKYLTNPSTREALVKAMIKNKQWNKNIVPAIQTGAQGTLNR